MVLHDHQEARAMSTCIAYRDEDGRLCGAPATIFDAHRGRMVCRAHVPQLPRLRRLAGRAHATHPGLLATTLAEETDEDLAQQLGCDVATVLRLRLCYPRGPSAGRATSPASPRASAAMPGRWMPCSSGWAQGARISESERTRGSERARCGYETFLMSTP
jgi:hypothetical protein